MWLAVTYPEICAMQARAIFEVAVHVAKSSAAPIPEVMIRWQQQLLKFRFAAK